MRTSISLSFSEKLKAGIWGFITGDALGVPYEFNSRSEMCDSPAMGMTCGGTHDQPAGTWSDDSSMMLCVLENIHVGGSTRDLGHLFLRWVDEGYHSPHGEVFDIGVTTQIALERFRKGKLDSGLDDERSAGNGSLMRSLPYAFYENFAEGVSTMLRDNAITHRVWLCQQCCIFYIRMARALAEGDSKPLALKKAGIYLRQEWAIQGQQADISQASLFDRLFDDSFPELPLRQIRSGGYVMESLEAAVWSFMNGTDYRSTVLSAVNLGDDTDTIGGLAGGLAGIHYGINDIPSDWLGVIVGRQELEQKIAVWLAPHEH